MPASAPQPSLDREHARRLYTRGTERLLYGDLSAARAALQEALLLDADLSQAHYELGNCLRRLGLHAEAETSFKTAVSQSPALFPAWFSLAFLYRDLGRTEQARLTLLELCQHAGGQHATLHQAGGLLADMGCYAEAAAIYEGLLQVEPLAKNHQRLGQYYQKLGRFEDAALAFAAAIEKNPDSGSAYLFSAHTRRFTQQDLALIESYQAALHRTGLSADTQACIHFALGKMLDDLGRYADAFGHFQQGNRIRHAEHTYDASQWQRFTATIQAMPGLDLPLSISRSATPAASPVPVFVVGMLRSGTTLVERILASHPQVFGAGERPWLSELAEMASEMTGLTYPHSIAALTDTQLATLRRGYTDRWSVPARAAGYVVDKNPMNFVHLGFILRLFPAAKIIHCLRDPLDTCLSIYFQNFADTRNAYAYALADIGHFYAGYVAIMDHWRHRLPPANLHEIRYEALVADQEAETRRLLEAVDLPWDPACLDFHRHSGSITTASFWQARQPIYTDAVGRARHYAQYLQPLIQALGSIATP